MSNSIIFPVLHKNIADLPFYITGISTYYTEGGVTRPNGYADCQWSICIEGSGEFIIDNKSYEIQPNMVFFFRNEIPHQYFIKKGPWITKWVTFNGNGINNLLNYMNMNTSEIICLNQRQRQETDFILDDIFNILGSSDSEKYLKTSSLLYKFLIKMKDSKEYLSKDDNLNLYKKLQPVITFMEKNYNNNITLEEMAEKINVNKHYLCRIFKKTYLITPFEYLNQLRIQKSKEIIIKNKQFSIKETAFNVGFNDTSYFCSIFKKIEGCTPVEFKRRY